MPYSLHPLSVPYRVVQSLAGIVPVLFIAAFAGGQAFPVASPLFVLLILVAVGGVIGWHVAYYRRFEYELTTDTFDIRSGVISRRNREIPYGRIQNVDISRTLVQRAMGVAELRIETAGGTSSEAHLRYVGYDEAKRLQDALRDRERHERPEPADGEEAPEVDRGSTLYQITPKELGILAVASFDLRVASFVFVILTIVAPSQVIGVVTSLPIDPIVVVAASVLVIVLASAILSGGSAIVNNYGFTLSQIGDELRYERGLLQRYDGSIPLDKVQTLIISENVLKRLVGYASLTVETAGYAPGQGSAESASAVPIAPRERTFSIANGIESAVEEREFVRPARRARIRYTIRYVILVAVATAVAFAVSWFFEVTTFWWAIPVTVVLAPVAAHAKWKHRGFSLAEEAIFTQAGFWRRQTHVVPFYRIQTVDESQTILQRRWHIATVVVDTAGSSGLVAGSPTAYDLDDQQATELREQLSGELQESLELWKRTRRDRNASRWDPV